MRKILLLVLAFALPGCGKFLDKFSRLDEGYTRVELLGDRSPGAALDGGIMVIFGRSGSGNGGNAFGFSSAELANGRSVVVPNGSYKVYAYGADSGGILQGQAKCGLGNGGADVNLSGGSTTVSISLSAANCAFGTTSVFSDADYANIGGTNFDTLNFEFCSTVAYPGCDTVSASTYRVKFRLAGGYSPGSSSFYPSEADSITSACSPAPSSGTITSSFLAFVGADAVSPPAELLIYNDSTCSNGIVGRLALNDGLRHYRSVATGSTVYLYSPASSSTTTLRFKFP